MKGLVLIALVLLAVFEMLERYDRPPALPFVHASAPTDPEDGARGAMRVAPCVTIEPEPPITGDDA